MNNVVIISGATSGIGMACVYKFAEEGFDLVITGRNEKVLEELQKKIENVRVHYIVADLSDLSSPKKIVEETISVFGRIDAIVNAAGIIASGTIENTELKDWQDMFRLNVDSIFLMIQEAIPHIERSELKSIVNVSSVVGLRQFPGVLSYSVSKAALDQLTKVVALELTAKKIRVNGINPGVIITNLHKRGGMNDKKYADFLEHSKTTHPIGRVGRADEAADLIYFLASDKSGFITGQTIAIDGGRSLTCFR